MAQKKQAAKSTNQTRDGDGRFIDNAAAAKPSASADKGQASKDKPSSSKKK